MNPAYAGILYNLATYMALHLGGACMVEHFSLKGVPTESKIKLLKALGYESDGIFVLDKDGNKVKDKYVDVDVELSRMLIFPGSTVVLDNNPLSIASYLEEFGDVL